MISTSFAFIVQATSASGAKSEDIAGFTTAQDAFNFAEFKHNTGFGDNWNIYIWESSSTQLAVLGTQRGVFYARSLAEAA